MATETRPDDPALRAAFASVVTDTSTLTRRMVITRAHVAAVRLSDIPIPPTRLIALRS